MKKLYNKPTWEIVYFENEDVITASAVLKDGGIDGVDGTSGSSSLEDIW